MFKIISLSLLFGVVIGYTLAGLQIALHQSGERQKQIEQENKPISNWLDKSPIDCSATKPCFISVNNY